MLSCVHFCYWHIDLPVSTSIVLQIQIVLPCKFQYVSKSCITRTQRHQENHVMKCLKHACGRTPDPNCRTKSCRTYSSHAFRADAIMMLTKGCGAVGVGLERSHNQFTRKTNLRRPPWNDTHRQRMHMVKRTVAFTNGRCICNCMMRVCNRFSSSVDD